MNRSWRQSLITGLVFVMFVLGAMYFSLFVRFSQELLLVVVFLSVWVFLSVADKVSSGLYYTLLLSSSLLAFFLGLQSSGAPFKPVILLFGVVLVVYSVYLMIRKK